MKFERASTYNFGATKLNRRRVSGATPDKCRCGITTAMLAGTATFHSPAGNPGQAKKELIARPGHGITAWHGTPRR